MYRFVETEVPFDRPIWRLGRPAPIWLERVERIDKFVTAKSLKALPPEHYPFEASAMVAQKQVFVGADEPPPQVRRIPFPGGMKVAHLHHGDQVYLLTDEQWTEFSSQVIEDFQERLGAARRVNVQQLAVLSEAISKL